MSTRNKIMIAAVAVLFVVVGVLLVIAIPEDGPLHRDEAGLLTGCPDPVTGILDYDAEGCTMVLWLRSQIPISIYVTTDNPHPVRPPREAVGAAIEVWNTRLGFDLFELVGTLEEADAVFRTGTTATVGTWEADANGAVQHRRGERIAGISGPLVAEVRTWNTGTLGIDHEVNVHELAHLAGLAHDPFADSAVADPEIYPIRSSTELRRIWITDHDRDLLRGLYRD